MIVDRIITAKVRVWGDGKLNDVVEQCVMEGVKRRRVIFSKKSKVTIVNAVENLRKSYLVVECTAAEENQKGVQYTKVAVSCG